MISFNYETDFRLAKEAHLEAWLTQVISTENFKLGDINYVFCDDEYLHKLNLKFLGHDTFTDIISFDDSVGKTLHGDIFISVDRVTDNAKEFKVEFEEELQRVMVHGILHFCGFKDKTKEEAQAMRNKENHYLNRLVKIS